MSVSLKSSKQAMYAEIERLRTECSRLEATQHVEAKVVRDKTIFIAAAKAQRAEFQAARTAFVAQWCRDNGVSSCPGDVVDAWANARR